jgi:hypothetical protein
MSTWILTIVITCWEASSRAGDFEQAGLSIGCDAHLWVVNQVTGEVFEVDSGEAAACAYAEIAWLSINPSDGYVPQGESQPVDVVFDASAAPIGVTQASLVISNDTPYSSITIPVTLYNQFLHLPLFPVKWREMTTSAFPILNYPKIAQQRLERGWGLE